MPAAIFLGGPYADEDDGGLVCEVEEIQTLPGWECWKKPDGWTDGDPVHVWRTDGTVDWQGRWVYRYRGLGEPPAPIPGDA